MNLFLQGMRRSGTTICFDIFKEDPAFDCYYEPLAAASKAAVGGGSGVRSQDFFEKIRRHRTEFLEIHPVPGGPDSLNYGAPRDPLLEFEGDLPEHVKAYIRFLTERNLDTLIKFTRMYCKVRVLNEIDPTAKLIHIVRNPAAVATSYLYGKHQKNRRLFQDGDGFFLRKSQKTAWSSYPFSEYLLGLPEYRHLPPLHDFERVLLVWKHLFYTTHVDGMRLFGDRYKILSHDALTARTVDTLSALYRFLERPIPEDVMSWAVANVRRRKDVHDAPSSHWKSAYDKLHLEREVSILREEGIVYDVS
jgi:hypothetical protein